jgi:hypothetical protein
MLVEKQEREKAVASLEVASRYLWPVGMTDVSSCASFEKIHFH